LPVAQVGSLVVIPQGPVRLVAAVTLVGIAELSGALEPSGAVQVGDRWLQVQLLGQLDGVGKFRRGVSTFPGLDDPVHFTVGSDLSAVFPAPSDALVRIGGLSAAPDVPVTLRASSLVVRHAAVVGSTGSGKTSAVATLIQNFVRGGWSSANILVVDPHGEYSAALRGHARVRSVLGTGDDLLRVPYWALPADNILKVFAGEQSSTVQTRFRELVRDARAHFAANATWLDIADRSITVDSPIPFDIHQVWYDLDYENRATYSKAGGAGEVMLEEEGSPTELLPSTFQPYGAGGGAPFKGPKMGHYGQAPDRIRAVLADPLYRFLLEPAAADSDSDPLEQVVVEWLGGTSPVSVLDFSGVPAEATDVAVGLIMGLLFELAVRSEGDGIGRSRPVLVMLEEAHRYLSDTSSAQMARTAANRIAKEGRKYGIGVTLITQRPSELPDTALSQVGTMIALRLTNGRDQGTVKAALPDTVAGLADALPALRTGEAIVAGEAVSLPTRTQFDRPSPEPLAADPPLDTWRAEAHDNDVRAALARWRGATKEEGDD